MTGDQYGLKAATRRFWLRIVEYTVLIAIAASAAAIVAYGALIVAAKITGAMI